MTGDEPGGRDRQEADIPLWRRIGGELSGVNNCLSFAFGALDLAKEELQALVGTACKFRTAGEPVPGEFMSAIQRLRHLHDMIEHPLALSAEHVKRSHGLLHTLSRVGMDPEP